MKKISVKYPFLTKEVEVYERENGHKIVLAHKEGGLVNISTRVKTGSINETDNNNGISHFLEHLMFKGTHKHKAGEFDRILESKGAIVNAATWKDYTFYYVTLPKGEDNKDFYQALELHADMMIDPVLPPEKIGAPFDINDKTYSFKVPLVGLYNAYNALAAIAVAFENGITNIQSALNSYKSEFGRSEIKKINGKTAIIQLIKNPTGASEVLKTVDLDSNILIAINDNYADGRDVSWLWDADFELLREAKKPIYTSGGRAYDMAIRLKYAGIQNIKVVQNIDEAIERISLDKTTENITILPTYTALLHINNKGV